MTPEEILPIFRRNGYALSHFAEDFGARSSSASMVFNGKSAAEPMMRAATTAARLLLRLEAARERELAS